MCYVLGIEGLQDLGRIPGAHGFEPNMGFWMDASRGCMLAGLSFPRADRA